MASIASLTTADGVRLDYTESGSPGGQPVVLLAGFKAPRTSWRYNTRALDNAGYRVLTVDLRGHGTSERPEAGNGMARRAADVDEFLTALDVHDAAIVGQSMGGNTIWAYLERFGSGRVSRIAIADQTPRMLNSVEWRHGFYGYEQSNRDTMFATGIPATGHGTPLAQRGMRLIRMLRAISFDVRGAGQFTPGELELLHDHAVADWRPTIARTTLPVLFVAGAESEVWPSSHAAASAALVAEGAGSSQVIENAGHGVNVEQPRSFDEVLLRFLRA